MAIPKVMQALQYASYGGGASALKHVEIPVPTPKAGEILVKLETASINPVDWKIQSGALRPFLPFKFPCVPGTDVAGEVVSVGPTVESFSIGDKIMSFLDIRIGGSLTEYAVALPRLTVKRPEGVSAIDGCSLPVAGMTALQAIRDSNGAGLKLDGTSKANLLITAASGGVGTYAVQIAKLTGAHVTATCGARNIDLVKNLGADEVLDYKTPEGDELKSPSGRKYDVIIHCATGIPWSKFSLNLAPNGRVIDLTPSFKSVVHTVLKKITFSKQKFGLLLMSPKAEDLQLLGELVKDGKLRTIVDSQYPLAKAEEAWARSIGGHATGKVVVNIQDVTK